MKKDFLKKKKKKSSLYKRTQELSKKKKKKEHYIDGAVMVSWFSLTEASVLFSGTVMSTEKNKIFINHCFMSGFCDFKFLTIKLSIK